VLFHLRGADSDYPIVDFNPWELSGTGNLTLSLLRELDSILKTGKAGEKSEKASKWLEKYAARLIFAGTAVKSAAPVLVLQHPLVGGTGGVGGATWVLPADLSGIGCGAENERRNRIHGTDAGP